MRAKKHLALLLSSCLCLSLTLTSCTKSNSEKTVQQFLEAYQKNDQTQMALYLNEPDSLGNLKIIQGLPKSVLDQYQRIFTDFTFAIEREEVNNDIASVYVKMTYKDAGTPSVEALHAYQDLAVMLDTDAIGESDVLSMLEETFSEALSHELEPIEEILVVPLSKDTSGNWRIIPSVEFQNALTANMGLMIAELDYYNTDIEAPQD